MSVSALIISYSRPATVVKTVLADVRSLVSTAYLLLELTSKNRQLGIIGPSRTVFVDFSMFFAKMAQVTSPLSRE